MHTKILLPAALLGALAVALGAFGAHGLKARVVPEQLQVFKTGVEYHFYHVFALLAVAVFYHLSPSKTLENAAWAFITGIIIFSGSLYIMTFGAAAGKSWKWLGAITPIGGVAFIAGWLMLAWSVWKGDR